MSTVMDITENTKNMENLKKLNSFMIDRELKMVELKNRIGELEGNKN